MCDTALRLVVVVLFFYQVDAEAPLKRQYSVAPQTTPVRKPCDTEQIEYRLTKLEVQVAEKDENIRSELRETNRRLQALEYQETDLQRAIDGLRGELTRVTGITQNVRQHDNSNENLNANIENTLRGINLIAAVLRTLNSDVSILKRNISELSNATNTILHQHHHLVTKQFLNNALVDVKHHQLLQPVPNNVIFGDNPKNCKDVLEKGQKESGIYLIQPHGSASQFMVKCEMEKLGGGWTYVHNRFEGSQDFYKDWHEYKVGFGNIDGEFWLGLEKIHQLTGGEVNELLVELEDFEDGKAHAHYSAFSIGSEIEGYSLKVLGGYSGTAGDGLLYHAGSRFSTKDLDQDGWMEGSCAQSHGGAWWYRGCDTSNLNGKYLNGNVPEVFTYQGMYWNEFKGAQYSLKAAKMMIRPRQASSVV